MRPPQPRASSSDANPRERERKQYQAKIATALNEEEDPLAVYHQFVQWTLKNYGENDPNSGLRELLEEATRQFQGDSLYKTDLRYLKLWALYARQVDRLNAISIYASLVANDIGTSYAALYEDYASLLEQDGRRQEADIVYRKGIKRSARPLERLKNRYQEFMGRSKTNGSSAPTSSVNPSTSTDPSRRNPFKSQPSQSRNAPTSAPSTTSANLVSFNSTPAQRYAHMLAPPAPGKRPEKLRFSLPLLFTEEGVEYSIQEARARSMGLLGKKWGPPPASESRFSSSSTARVDFNDDGQKSTRLMGRRKSLMAGGGAEPTVTINTKEALEDVFGMYNSPEKTNKFAMPGSKHAPLKKVEPVTPLVPPRVTFSHENENAVQHAKTPTAGFRPFTDENAKATRTPGAKFTPFVDPDAHKTPSFTTPRAVLSVKDSAVTPASRSNENAPLKSSALKPKPAEDEKPVESVFSKVFTPAQTKSVPLAPLRDVFTDDHGKPLPKPKAATHERAKSQHDLLVPKSEDSSRPPAFTPFVDENARTPFKVFSRPPECENTTGNAFTPKTPSAVFTPFQDAKTPAFTPFRDNAITPFTDKSDSTEFSRERKISFEPMRAPQKSSLSWANTPVEVEGDVEEEEQSEEPEDDQYDEENEPPQYGASIAPHHLPEEYEEGESYQEIPLGGRFGQFNVMTPITERTFEFTMSTRGAGTPSDRARDGGGSPVFIPPQTDEYGAARAAERLAAELREEGSQAYDGEEEEEEEEEEEDQYIEPLRLAEPEEDPAIAIIEERTGAMSLGDTLTLSSKFRPSNPCNPFDPPIISALLSRIPADLHFYDLRSQQSKQLEALQRFDKKARKTSGNSNSTGTFDMSACFPMVLNGHRFNVSEKLGEGGFGSVFRARDLGMSRSDEDDEDDDMDDDEDEEGASLVALKVVKPRNLWEYHVLRRLHSVLPVSIRRSIVLPHGLYAYSDESFLVLDLCPQGMLLNIVNNAVAAGVSQAGACLDELLVMFFSIELLNLIEAMHTAGFIHGDLKIDNCLLRLEDVPGGASAWSSIYSPSGEGGWSYKGLKVIDFGRAIDTRLFPSGQQFIADWPVDDRDCLEVRENRPWTFQTDYFGLAGIIYCMLFGKYIQANCIVLVSNGVQRYKIATPFKRYWQTDLWNRLFDVLLNPCLVRPNGDLPVCEELGGLRKEMETWLQSNCNRTSNTLKGLLKKVEMSCYTR